MFMKNAPLSGALCVIAAGLLAARAAGAACAPASASTNSPAPATPPLKAADLFPDAVIAKGKGVEVKRSQLDEDFSRLRMQYALSGRQIPSDQVPEMQRRLLDELIRTQLLIAKATDAEKAEAKKQAQKRFDDAKRDLGSEEVLNARLKAQDTTAEKLIANWTESLTAQTVLERDLKLGPTDADVKKFYDDNPSQFEQPEMVRASHILISTKDPADTNLNPLLQRELPPEQRAAKRKQAEELLKRARAGEDFAKLAKQYSDDKGSLDTGGEYTFPRGRMMPEFEAAAFALKTNEISDIVQTSYGYHIIKLSEKIPAKKVELSPDVASKVKDYLRRQEVQTHENELDAYFAKLQKDADVQILDETLKAKGNTSSSLLPPNHPPVTDTGAKKAAPEPAKKTPGK
jgi:parvulin-like peptidyl-prolyl isomerase